MRDDQREARIFVAAWEYLPIVSGESVVCKRTLEHSRFCYDVCCGPVPAGDDGHIRLLPVEGNKYLRWPWSVAKKFREMDQTEHYQVMMSRVMPPNGHLAGWLIKRLRPDIKWIVYFSDPIWNSPFLQLLPGKSGEQRPNWFLMKLFGLPAKWAVRECDLLVFNNERLARYILGKRYERYREKVVIAPYGHEGVHPRPAPQRGDGKFRLTHVGQIYGDRTFKALVDGAALLKRQRPELFERLAIRQVGFASEAELRRVRESGVAEAVEFVGQVPYAQSIEEMYQSDCLLVIDPVFRKAQQNVYIPGKLFDYMQTGRPIVCIAGKDSATGDMAGQTGCVRVPPEGEAVFHALTDVCSGIFPSCDAEHCRCEVGVERMDRAIEELLRQN